jgi:hypothetical protein
MAADLSITATDVAAVKVIEQETGPIEEAVDAGEMVAYDASTGMYELADQDIHTAQTQLVGIAIKTGNQANITVTVVRKGLIDLGAEALAGLNYGVPVYLSKTAGKIYDSDPGGGIVVGTVVPAWGSTTADKLLRVDL